eukprot:CAMPEP_0206836758 /NCGR_PEP_ID=MMETSP0975-20121206/20062_1 /ASSEMBLY_ACC=CAM_ASM_000399 /TAXON_ID=483370 /ORGANISM="non described non described, Strain CCMP2097" /LENGTH=206 /DNA_ID=CAMNT_0054379169 /DNA_START=107 /DNA_END=724 /DNA_ORIENTATION=+
MQKLPGGIAISAAAAPADRDTSNAEVLTRLELKRPFWTTFSARTCAMPYLISPAVRLGRRTVEVRDEEDGHVEAVSDDALGRQRAVRRIHELRGAALDVGRARVLLRTPLHARVFPGAGRRLGDKVVKARRVRELEHVKTRFHGARAVGDLRVAERPEPAADVEHALLLLLRSGVCLADLARALGSVVEIGIVSQRRPGAGSGDEG